MTSSNVQSPSSAAASQCGDGYDPSFQSCDACLQGFYERDGQCFKCKSIGAYLVPLLIFTGGALGVLGFVFIFLTLSVVLLLRRSALLPRSAVKTMGFRIAQDFLIMLIVLVQLLVQVSRTSSPGLPSWLRGAISVLQLWQFDVSGLFPPECDDGGGLREPIILGIWSAMGVLTIGLLPVYRMKRTEGTGKGGKGVAGGQRSGEKTEGRATRCGSSLGTFTFRLVLSFFIILFPLGVQTSVAAVHCIRQPVDDESGKSRLVRTLSRREECFSSSHSLLFTLGVVALLLNACILPILLLRVGYAQGRAVTMPSSTSAAVRASSTGQDSSGLKSRHQAAKHRRKRKSQSQSPSKGESSETRVSKAGHTSHCCKRSEAASGEAIGRRWNLPEETYSKLLATQGVWTNYYRFGQPWLRPWVFLQQLLLSVASVSSNVSDPLTRGFCIMSSAVVIGVFAFPTFYCRPDHRWAQWKRLPRLWLAECMVLMCFVQLSLLIDDAGRTGTASAVEGSQDMEGGNWVSSASTALIWCLVISTVFYVPLLFTAFYLWLCRLHKLSQSTATTPSSSLKMGKGHGGSAANPSFLSFLSHWSGEEVARKSDEESRSSSGSTPLTIRQSRPSVSKGQGTEPKTIRLQEASHSDIGDPVSEGKNHGPTRLSQVFEHRNPLFEALAGPQTDPSSPLTPVQQMTMIDSHASSSPAERSTTDGIANPAMGRRQMERVELEVGTKSSGKTKGLENESMADEDWWEGEEGNEYDMVYEDEDAEASYSGGGKEYVEETGFDDADADRDGRGSTRTRRFVRRGGGRGGRGRRMRKGSRGPRLSYFLSKELGRRYRSEHIALPYLKEAAGKKSTSGKKGETG